MHIVQYMVGCGRAQGIQWRLNYIHSMKYAEVINAGIAANSAGIDYSKSIMCHVHTFVLPHVIHILNPLLRALNPANSVGRGRTVSRNVTRSNAVHTL